MNTRQIGDSQPKLEGIASPIGSEDLYMLLRRLYVAGAISLLLLLLSTLYAQGSMPAAHGVDHVDLWELHTKTTILEQKLLAMNEKLDEMRRAGLWLIGLVMATVVGQVLTVAGQRRKGGS